jgi:hypothetical protein
VLKCKSLVTACAAALGLASASGAGRNCSVYPLWYPLGNSVGHRFADDKERQSD